MAELAIRDFAIIHDLHIEWHPGLNVLTGETGAGKSIVIDALGAALGDRAEGTWIRSDTERSMVEAIFAVPAQAARLKDALEELGAPADDEALILSRDLAPGRSVSRVNGRAVPVGSAQALAERLVDIHSQASHLSLLRPREQLELLDRYSRTGDRRTDMAMTARALAETRREIRRFEESDRQTEREAVLLRHEVGEIDAVGLREGEEEELSGRRARLKNALRLQQLAIEAAEALHGTDHGHGAVDLLQVALDRVAEIRALDPSFSDDGEVLAQLVDAAEGLAREARRYPESLEDDPRELDRVEERIVVIADLKRKYGSTVAEVLAYLAQAARRLEEMEDASERLESLRREETDRLEAARGAAMLLSTTRGAAARDLEAAVEPELAVLGMEGARFVVELRCRPDPAGLRLDGADAPVAFDESGVDQVEFLFSANPGEPPRPLGRIASGGELARVMLALKSVLSAVDETPILVFDELDQGVGGRTGHVIGERLYRLAAAHQVLCISHLPQIAAYADAHFRVEKAVEHARATTRVRRLSADERSAELALMLAGPQAGPAAQRSAEELLAHASEWKAL